MTGKQIAWTLGLSSLLGLLLGGINNILDEPLNPPGAAATLAAIVVTISVVADAYPPLKDDLWIKRVKILVASLTAWAAVGVALSDGASPWLGVPIGLVLGLLVVYGVVKAEGRS